MTCLITDCDLVDVRGGRWVHGDLYEVGDAFVFNACIHHKDCLAEEQVAGETAWEFSNLSLVSKKGGSKLLVLLPHARPFERRGVIVVAKNQAAFNKAAEDFLLGARR